MKKFALCINGEQVDTITADNKDDAWDSIHLCDYEYNCDIDVYEETVYIPVVDGRNLNSSFDTYDEALEEALEYAMQNADIEFCELEDEESEEIDDEDI